MQVYITLISFHSNNLVPDTHEFIEKDTPMYNQTIKRKKQCFVIIILFEEYKYTD